MGLRVGCATVPSKTEGAAREPSASLAALSIWSAGAQEIAAFAVTPAPAHFICILATEASRFQRSIIFSKIFSYANLRYSTMLYYDVI